MTKPVLLLTIGAIIAVAGILLLSRPPGAIDATHDMPCADLDGDGLVRVIDLLIEFSYLGQTVPPAPPQVDMNGDTVVDQADYDYVEGEYGTSTECQDKPVGGKGLEFVWEFIIASEGGTVSTGTGDPLEATLTVPPGALDVDTLVTISVLPASAVPPLQGSQSSSGQRSQLSGTLCDLPNIPNPANCPDLLERVFDLGPDDEVLNTPAELELSYTDGAITGQYEDALGVLHLVGGKWEYVPVIARNTGANTITVEIDSFSPYGIYEPAVADTDSDGCLDTQEDGAFPNQGGLRNPLYHWDVFDTPTDANVRDKMIRTPDIMRVVYRYGASGDPSIDPLSPPPAAPGYHTAFDRGGPAGPNDWDQAPPNGQIRVLDINAVVNQYGLTC